MEDLGLAASQRGEHLTVRHALRQITQDDGMWVDVQEERHPAIHAVRETRDGGCEADGLTQVATPVVGVQFGAQQGPGRHGGPEGKVCGPGKQVRELLAQHRQQRVHQRGV